MTEAKLLGYSSYKRSFPDLSTGILCFWFWFMSWVLIIHKFDRTVFFANLIILMNDGISYYYLSILVHEGSLAHPAPESKISAPKPPILAPDPQVLAWEPQILALDPPILAWGGGGTYVWTDGWRRKFSICECIGNCPKKGIESKSKNQGHETTIENLHFGEK